MANYLLSVLKGLFALLLFLLLIVAIASYWLLNTQNGLAWALEKASPLIKVNTVSGSVLSPELQGLVIENESFKISAQSAKLKWQWMALLSKSLTINSLDLTQLDVIIKASEDQPPAPYQPWRGLDIPIEIDLQQVHVAGFSIVHKTVQETVQNQRQDAVNTTAQKNNELLSLEQIDLQASVKNNQLEIQQFDIKESDNIAKLLGSVDLTAAPDGKVDLQHSISWAVPSYQITTKGSVNGEWQKLDFRQSVVSPYAVELDATVSDALTELLSWSANISGSQFPDQQLFGDVVSIGDGVFESRGQFAPGLGLESLQVNVNGGLSVESEKYANWQIETSTNYQQGNLKIDKLRLNQLDIQDSRTLEVSGLVNNVLGFVNDSYGVGEVDVSGQWNQLQWPIVSAAPELTADGQFTVVGRSNNYQITAATQGQLQGRNLQADVAADLTTESIVINQLNLISGDTTATINGKIDTAFAINWEFNSPDIGDLLPNASGSLISTGQLTGLRDKPAVSLQAESKNLLAYDYSVQALQLNADASLADWQDKLNIVLNAQNISNADGRLVRSVDLLLTGTGLQHSLNVDAKLRNDDSGLERGDTDISLKANGGINGQDWLGQLSELTLTNPLINTWSLNQSVDLELGLNKVNVSEACLVNNDQAICFEASQKNQQLEINGTIQSLNLANLDQFTSAFDINTVGIANGNFDYAKQASHDHADISAKLESDSASISWLDPDSQEQETLSIEAIKLSVQQQEVLDLSAYLSLNGGDLIDAKINIAEGFESLQFNSASLTGQVNISLQDIGNLPASAFIDLGAKGGVRSELTIDGSLADPRFNLLATVDDASIKIDDLGLDLQKINLQARSNNSQIIAFDGELYSGEGQLDIDGTFDLSDLAAPLISIGLSGENIQLANTLELNIIADVDIATEINSQLIDLSGSIVIDQAEFDYKLPDNAISASSDVVLAGQEQEVNGRNQKMDVSIDLGQNTHINAKGLDADLRGKLRVFQNPGGIMRGEGEINVVNGLYAAYGEELDIELGRLIFSSGSIDDPSLELRAQKTVNSIVAGVNVVGRASSPELNLYSSPSMIDEDILSVLVFGKPMTDLSSQDGLTLLLILNSLRGDGEASQLSKTTENIRQSLGLDDFGVEFSGDNPTIEAGKQISSKLYAGYGYGLLDAAQSLILRYKLSKQWSIKADMGADSGADIRYEIEQ